ncbi:PorP/SprF family type IX secretion system membrane protein [Mucilaginibacter sp. UYCu711]|uniref:PorP/SprF family type IX secretion system membrane protein n=1 Tax=Mucilaginibacter sp. UYCu711 TaxID=3156339 RepID=UPI003D20F8AA
MRNLTFNCAASKFYLILITLVTFGQVQAQDYYSSSQYMNNLTPINSAYSLLSENGSITSTIKKQWINLPGSPTTFTFNAQIPIESINSATGLTVMDSQLAVEELTEVNAFYAKSVQLSQNYRLGVAINAGIRRYVANYSSLDSSDPLFVNDVRKNQPNVGFCIMLYTNNFYVGLSMPEFSIKSLGSASIDDKLYFKNRYNFTAACLLNISQGIDFKPAGLFTYVSGSPIMSEVSGTFFFNRVLGMGLDLKSNNKLAGILSVGLAKFSVGYSYQFGVASNNLGGTNFSTHEIALSYNFGKYLSSHSLL